MTAAKRQQLARELDIRVRCLRLTGRDDTALVAAMSDRVADFQALMDAAGPDGMDGLTGRLPDLRHFASLLTSFAAVVREGTIKATELMALGIPQTPGARLHPADGRPDVFHCTGLETYSEPWITPGMDRWTRPHLLADVPDPSEHQTLRDGLKRARSSAQPTHRRVFIMILRCKSKMYVWIQDC